MSFWGLLELLGLLSLVRLAGAGGENAVELNLDIYSQKTDGMTVLLAWFPADCAEPCTQFREKTWQHLMYSYSSLKAFSDTVLLASIDCSDAGKSLCDKRGMTSFPVEKESDIPIRWGDPNMLDEYTGRKDFHSLRVFVGKTLKTRCSAFHPEVCEQDPEQKLVLERFRKQDEKELKEKAKRLELLNLKMEVEYARELNDLKKKQEWLKHAPQSHFEQESRKLSELLFRLRAEKRERFKRLETEGLGLMKSVLAYKAAVEGNGKIGNDL